MPENEKKGITVKIDAQLHAQVKEFVEANGMTMAEFVSKALDDELHPKITQEVNKMETKTLAFQVPIQIYNQIKEYLSRHHMTQKDFVIGLITTELEHDMALHSGVAEEQAAPDEREEETEGEELDDDESEDAELDEDESEGEELDEDESEGEELDNEESEDEDMNESEGETMSLGM